MRFTFVKRLADSTPRESLRLLAERVKQLGLHVVIYFELHKLPGLYEFIASLTPTVVVDHMGRPDANQPVDGLQFSLLMRLMRVHENVWCKVTIVGEFSDRVLWGTDWPHPNMKPHMPDDGTLVDNPMRLYWSG